MTLSLTEYLQRDFTVEQVDATLIEYAAAGRVQFPAVSRPYFHLVLSGEARLELEESRQSTILKQGDFALLLYGAAHTFGNAQHKSAVIVHVCDQLSPSDEPPIVKLGDTGPHVLSGYLQLQRILRSAPVNRALPHLLHYCTHHSLKRAGIDVSNDMTQIETTCRGPGASAFVFCIAQLYLVQTLRRAHDDLQRILPLPLGSPDMGRMAAAVRKIRAHPEKRWTVAALAQEVGYSRSSFAAKFNAYAGMGPITFVARTRLTRAAAMLKSNPELPLWEVAKRLGFELRHYRKVLSPIADGDRRRWLLKDPTTHSWAPEQLLETFPDALYVYTHRDPIKAMASVSDMIYPVRSNRISHLTPQHHAHKMVKFWAPAMEKLDAALSRVDPSRIIDIHMDELPSDPIGASVKIYDYFGLPVTATARQAWQGSSVRTRAAAMAPIRSSSTVSACAPRRFTPPCRTITRGTSGATTPRHDRPRGAIFSHGRWQFRFLTCWQIKREQDTKARRHYNSNTDNPDFGLPVCAVTLRRVQSIPTTIEEVRISSVAIIPILPIPTHKRGRS